MMYVELKENTHGRQTRRGRQVDREFIGVSLQMRRSGYEGSLDIEGFRDLLGGSLGLTVRLEFLSRILPANYWF